MEAASQVGETVIFNDVDELGLSNTRLFTCEVKVGRLTKCRGSGNNKKMAKANAADQALELIKSRVGDTTNLPRSSKVSPNHTSSSQAASPMRVLLSPAGRLTQDPPSSEDTNPVGSLQEMCMKNNWAPPCYDVVCETGESHMKTFIYECKVESWIAQGQGRNKKTAKKLAAENLLSMIKQATKSSSLHDVNTSSLSGSPFRSFPDKSWPKMNPQSDPGPSTSHPTSSPVPFLSSTLYDEMECEDQQSFEETSPGTLPLVTEDGISEEFRSSLADRGKISGFTITYHDLLEKGYSGNYMCFVRLDTKPPAVCNGVGPTKTYAHEKAAQNALQYLNTVCS
ncbi:hypothetical protein ACROYT_G037606 [Oculina patagonica]